MWKIIGKLLVKYGPGLVEVLIALKRQQDAATAEAQSKAD